MHTRSDSYKLWFFLSGRIAPSLTSDGRVLSEIHLLHNNQTLGDNNNLWLHKSLVWDYKQANCGALRRRSGRRHRSQGDSAGGVCSSIFAAVDVNTMTRGWCVLVHTVRSLQVKMFWYFLWNPADEVGLFMAGDTSWCHRDQVGLCFW